MSIKKRAAIKELQKRARLNVKRVPFDVINYCDDHYKQLSFIQDKSKRKAASPARRSGKSSGVAGDLLEAAEEIADGLVYYVTTTIGKAEAIMWRPLLKLLSETYSKDELYIHHSKHLVRLPNGSEIRLAGCPNIAAIPNFIGLAYTYFCIDEAQKFQIYLLDLLIREAVEPALIDYDGVLVLIGTPALVHAGPFYEAIHDTGNYCGYSIHNWDMRDNPHLWRKNNTTFEKFITKELKRRKLDTPDATMLREYYGKWVQGTDELVYRFNSKINEYDPENFNLDSKFKWHYICGVDLGSKDESAFVVYAFSYNHPVAYVIEDFASPRMDITTLMTKLKAIENKYDIEVFVFDPSAGGANFIDEINNRFVSSAVAADKMDKWYWIKLFNDTLGQGNIKVPKGSELPLEWGKLVAKIDNDGRPKEDKSQLNHRSDAALYGLRYIHSYAWTKMVDKPGVFDDEYDDQYIKNVEEELRVEKEDEEYWDDYYEEAEDGDSW